LSSNSLGVRITAAKNAGYSTNLPNETGFLRGFLTHRGAWGRLVFNDPKRRL
jgi:hypothetical protein